MDIGKNAHFRFKIWFLEAYKLEVNQINIFKYTLKQIIKTTLLRFLSILKTREFLQSKKFIFYHWRNLKILRQIFALT